MNWSTTIDTQRSLLMSVMIAREAVLINSWNMEDSGVKIESPHLVVQSLCP
jgi:hypothetical protein